MKFYLSHSDYLIEDMETYHLMFARGEDGNKYAFKTKYHPYFYVNYDDWNRIEDIFSKKDCLKYIKGVDKSNNYVGVNGKRLIKVFVSIPYYLPFIRDYLEEKSITTYEADVLYYVRFLIDSGIRFCFEVDDEIIKLNNKNGVVPITFDKVKPLDVDIENTDPKFKVAYLDIEAYAKNIEKFKRFEGILFLATLYLPEDDAYYVFYTGKQTDIDYKQIDGNSKIILLWNKDERALVRSLLMFLQSKQIDKVVSFTDIDLRYILARGVLLNLNIEQYSMVRRSSVKWEKKTVDGVKKNVKLINASIPDIEIVDFAMVYTKMSGEPTFFTLDYISKKELGVGKIQISSVKELWEKGAIKELIEYNIRDVEILKLLEKKLSLMKSFTEPIRRIVGCNTDTALIPSKVGDIMYLRYVRKIGVILHTRPIFPCNWKKEGYKGAIVFNPVGGRHKDVIVFDWSELYPSVIETFNIGWNTFRSEKSEIDISGRYFTTSEESWTVSIMKPLREYRQKIKKLKKAETDPSKKQIYETLSFALKTIINALYGLFGYAGEAGVSRASRFYSPPIAESVTIGGQMLELATKEFFEKTLGYQVLYGDTDSIFIKAMTSDPEKEAIELKEKAMKFINDYVRENFKIEPKVSIDIDKIIKSLLIFEGIKKRYHSSEAIKGVEAVRKDTADITVEAQKTIGEMLLQEKDREAEEYYKGLLKKFMAMEIPIEKILVKARCSKTEYKVLTRNSKAIAVAKKLNNEEIEVGQRFYFAYIKPIKINGGYYNVVAFSKPIIPEGFANRIDWNKMCEYTLVKPLKKYLKIIGKDSYKIFKDVLNEIDGQTSLFLFI